MAAWHGLTITILQMNTTSVRVISYTKSTLTLIYVRLSYQTLKKRLLVLRKWILLILIQSGELA